MASLQPVTITINTELKDNITQPLKESIKYVDAYTKSLEQLRSQFKTLHDKEVNVTLGLEDNASESLGHARKDISYLDGKRAIPSVSVRDDATRTIRDLEEKTNKLNKTKATVTATAKDDATSTITGIKGKISDLNGRTARTFVTAADQASEVINTIWDNAKSLASRPIEMVVSLVDKATSPIRGIYNWMTSLQGLVTGFFAGKTFEKFVADPIGLADFYTTAETGFATMLGSAEKAQKMMNDINEFAITTPFKAQGLVDTSQKMLAMGWAAEDILPDLNDIGNAMAALGKGDEGIERVTLALSQMRAKGKVSAEEMNQLTEAGIGAWKYLSESIGVSTAEAQDMVSKGLIPVDEAIRGLIGGMKEFDGFMVKTANDTVEGLLSQIQDSVSVNIFKPWGDGLKNGVQPGLERINNLLSSTLQGSTTVQEALSRTGEQLASGIMNTAADLTEKFAGIINSVEFQNASLGQKVEMLLKEGIEKPIGEWWNSGGKDTVTRLAKDGMSALGSIIKESIPVLIEAAFSNPVTGTIASAWGLKLGSNVISGLANTLSGGRKMISNTKDMIMGAANLKNVGFKGFGEAVLESGSLTGALKLIGQTSANTISALEDVVSTGSRVGSTMGDVFKMAYQQTGSLSSAFKTVQTITRATETSTDGLQAIFKTVAKESGSVTSAFEMMRAATMKNAKAGDVLQTTFKSVYNQTGSMSKAYQTVKSIGGGMESALTSARSASEKLPGAFKEIYKETGSLSTAFKAVQTASGGAEKAISATATSSTGLISSMGGMLPVLGGAAAAVGVLTTAYLYFKNVQAHALDAYQDEIKKTDELIDRTKSLSSTVQNNVISRNDSIKSLITESVQAKTLTDRIFDLNESQEKTAESQKEMAGYVEMLNNLYPDMNVHYDEATQKLMDEEGAIYATRDALRHKIDTLKEATLAQAGYNIMSEASTDYMKSMMDMPALEAEMDRYQQLYDEAQDKANQATREALTNPFKHKEALEAQEQARGFREELDRVTETYQETGKSISQTSEQILRSAQLAGTDGAAYLQELTSEMVNSGAISQETADKTTQAFMGMSEEVGVRTQEMSDNVRAALSGLPGTAKLAGEQTGQSYSDAVNNQVENAKTAGENLANGAKSGAESVDFESSGRASGSHWYDGFLSAAGNIGSWISEKVSAIGNFLHGGGTSSGTPGIAGTIPHRAEGGIMDSAHLALVAEDGPEAIIPLGNKRRSKGVKLWEEAGRRLGVYAHAEGGISSGGSSAGGGDVKASVDANFSTANNNIDGFLRSFESMAGGIVSVGDQSFSQVESIIAGSLSQDQSNFNSFVGAFNNRAQQGIGIQFPGIVNNGMNSTVSNVQNGTNGMYAALQSGEGPFYNEGQTLMSLLNSGINSRRSEVLSSASSLVEELKSRFEEGLGIHSPSRYMKWVGEMMLSGLIGGLSGSELDSFIESIIGDMKNSFQAGSFDPYQLVNYLGNDSTVSLIGKINGLDMDDLAAGTWVYPVQGQPFHENAPYHEWRGTRYHQGIDLMAPMYTPIVSVMDGTVSYAGGAGGTGFGNHVIVDHGNGYNTTYAHFASVDVSRGQPVTAGQLLGKADSTGNSTGSHLHFELRNGLNGDVEEDPTGFLQGASFAGAGNPLSQAIQQAYNAVNGIATGSAKGSIPWDFSAGVSQWLPTVQQALDITGQSREYANDILWAIQNESGGNPNARNDWDSNAAMGDPSRGLMQTIGSTFNAYRNPNLSANIYDPLSNIVAGINYMLSRYGSIEAVVGPRRNKWYGYATGTDYATAGLHWVGENGPELLQFRGGERVYTADESRRIAQGTKIQSINGVSANSLSTPKIDTNTAQNGSQTQIPVSVGNVNVTISLNGNIENGQDFINTIEQNADEIGNIIVQQLAKKLNDTSEGTPVGKGLA